MRPRKPVIGEEQMRVLRARAEKMPDQKVDLEKTLAFKIKQADHQLRVFRTTGLSLIPTDAPRELMPLLTDIASWQARRRALIEVWELVENQVWKGSSDG